MKHQNLSAVPRVLVTAIATALMAVAGSVLAAPTYHVSKIVHTVKPHETDSDKGYYGPYSGTSFRDLGIWVASNEGDVETGAGNGGITIFSIATNSPLSHLSVECGQANIPVINPNGSIWGMAPCGAEGHPRHPHGLDINMNTNRVYQVIEHSGLKWNATRTAIVRAATTDAESGLLVEINISDIYHPKIVRSWLLGHAAEEDAVNENNGKVYVGNHEPSPGVTPASWVSVIKPNAAQPYGFINLPVRDDIQGIAVDEPKNLVFGVTHVGEKMYAFNSANDTIAYKVGIRAAFNAQVGGVPAGDVLHMHDLTVDKTNHRVYQSIHTLAPPDAEEVESVEGTEEPGVVNEDSEIRGHWVAEVDTLNGNKVTIINVPGVHAHFLDVDHDLGALLVSGEHTGNLGVVDTNSRTLTQKIKISPPDPTPPLPGETPNEPEVHGVNINKQTHNAYISDETDWNQTVTVLKPY